MGGMLINSYTHHIYIPTTAKTRWKASMAGKPITVLSPEPQKEEPKPVVEAPPAAPPTKQERMRELMARNKK